MLSPTSRLITPELEHVIFEAKSLGEWLDAQRVQESQDDRVDQLADLLTPMFVFLANGIPRGGGRPPKRPFGTMHIRSWTLLYCVRPDLLSGETPEQASQRFGFDRADICKIVAEFEEYFPHYRRPRINGWARKEADNESREPDAGA